MNVQCIPTDWHNQIDIVMVIGGARPVPQVDVAPGRGQWLRDLVRGDRSSVPRGGPRPASRSIRRPVGTQQTGLFAPLRGQAQCAHNIDGRGMLMFYSHDEKSYVG